MHHQVGLLHQKGWPTGSGYCQKLIKVIKWNRLPLIYNLETILVSLCLYQRKETPITKVGWQKVVILLCFLTMVIAKGYSLLCAMASKIATE
jgi:hypothetical protein